MTNLLKIALYLALANPVLAEQPIQNFSTEAQDLLKKRSEFSSNCYGIGRDPSDPQVIDPCYGFDQTTTALERIGVCQSFFNGEGRIYYDCSDHKGFSQQIDPGDFPYGIHLDALEASWVASTIGFQRKKDGGFDHAINGGISISCRPNEAPQLILEVAGQHPELGEFVEVAFQEKSNAFTESVPGKTAELNNGSGFILGIFDAEFIGRFLANLHGSQAGSLTSLVLKNVEQTKSAVIFLSVRWPLDEAESSLLKSSIASLHQSCGVFTEN